MGYNLNIFLPKLIFLHLQNMGKVTLNQISNPEVASLWKQGWLTIDDINLDGDNVHDPDL
jgi:hypothetical protein